MCFTGKYFEGYKENWLELSAWIVSWYETEDMKNLIKLKWDKFQTNKR